MSTNRPHPPPLEDDDQRQRAEDEGEALMHLLEALDEVDEKSEEAKHNKCSISDNNGGRVELMKQRERTFPLFLFLRRLLSHIRRRAKPEQGDGV